MRAFTDGIPGVATEIFASGYGRKSEREKGERMR